MAEVDTSFYPKATNPLENLSQAVQIGGVAQRNQLLQQELGANQGIQQLYANAPTDASGNIDQNYLLKNAGQAGIRAPEIIQAAQGAQVTAQQISQQKFAAQRAKMSMMAAAVAPLAKPGSTPSDFVSSANDLIQNSNGLISKQDLLPIYGAMAAHLANGGNTSDYAQKTLGQLLIGGGDPKEGMALLNMNPISMHTGGGTTTGTQNPVTGAVTTSGYIPDTLPATTPVVDASGATHYVGGTAPTGASGGSAGASPLAGAFGTTGAGTGTTGGGPAMASLPPGTQAMLGNAGASAQKRVDDTIQTAQQARVSQDVNQQIVNLAGNLKDNVGPTKTGWTQLIGKIADTPVVGAGMKAVLDKDPADTNGQLQELQKYLLRSAQMRGQSLGLGGTDYQANLAQNASPHDTQFPKVIQNLAQYNLALDAIEQGKANALDQYPNAKTSPAANQQFENEFRNALNPNVFRALIASPQDRQALYASMTPQQRQQMVTDRRKLMSMGAIPEQLNNAFQPAAASQ